MRRNPYVSRSILGVVAALWLATPLAAVEVIDGVGRSVTRTTPTRPLRMLFFGDVMLERRLEPLIARHGVAHLFDGVQTLPDGRLLSSLDLVGANLEGAITPGGVHRAPDFPYDFAFSPERVAVARDAGISYFTIANNHLWDQGTDGVASTRRYLRELGLSFSGDVDARVSADSTTFLDVRGVNVAMVAFSSVYNPIDRDAVSRVVRDAARQADITVVNFHWGVEYEHVPSETQRGLAQLVAESGADFVIGHHPHVVQGMEIIAGTPVFYSLGNFVFDQQFSEAVQEGLAVEIEVHATQTIVSFFPFRSVDAQPNWRLGDDREDALADIASWSRLEPRFENQLVTGTLVIPR